VLGTRDLIAHVDVVGAHPRGEEPLHQRLHDLRIVVHALEQHRLTAERHAGVGQHAEGLHGGRRQLVGVVEVGVDEERVVLPQDGAQLRRNPLGEVAGHPAPDAHDLDVRDRAEALEDVVDAPVGQHQWVAARHDDVPDLLVLLEVAERRFQLRHRDLLGVPHLASPGAEPAVGGAHRRDQEERPVGVTMGDVRDRGIGVLVQRVDDAVVDFQLLDGGDVLAPDGIVRLPDEVHHGRRDAEFEVLGRLLQPLDVTHVLGAEPRRERLEGRDALLTKQFLPGLHRSRP
jgi:hypothetical protein